MSIQSERAAKALAAQAVDPLRRSFEFEKIPMEEVAQGLASMRDQFKSREGVSAGDLREFSSAVSDFYQETARERGVDLAKVQLPLEPPPALDQDSLESWEQDQIGKLVNRDQGFLYEGQIRSQVQGATTQLLRQQANQNPEDQGFFNDLFDGTLDLGKRVAEGAATGVTGIFDRDGSKAAAVQRYIATNPENDGKFIADLATGAGSLVPSVGSAIVGGALGTAIGPEGTIAGGIAGAAIGSGGYSLLLRSNEAYQTTYALTNSREKAEESWSGQIPAAAVDALSDITIARFLKPLKGVQSTAKLRAAAKELKAAKTTADRLKIIKKYDTAYVAAGLEGGLGEAIAEPLGDIMAARGLDPSIREGEIAKAWDNSGRSALLGFILGGAASTTLEGRGQLPIADFVKQAAKAGVPLDNLVDLKTGVVKPFDEIQKTLQDAGVNPVTEADPVAAGERRLGELAGVAEQGTATPAPGEPQGTADQTLEEVQQRADEIYTEPVVAPEVAPEAEPAQVAEPEEVAPVVAPEAAAEVAPEVAPEKLADDRHKSLEDYRAYLQGRVARAEPASIEASQAMERLEAFDRDPEGTLAQSKFVKATNVELAEEKALDDAERKRLEDITEIPVVAETVTSLDIFDRALVEAGDTDPAPIAVKLAAEKLRRQNKLPEGSEITFDGETLFPGGEPVTAKTTTLDPDTGRVLASPLPQVAEPAVVTDKAERQQLTNSVQEGESILKSGKKTSGAKMTKAELALVQRSVDSARAKLGEVAPTAGPKPLSKRQAAARDAANAKRAEIITNRVAGKSPNATRDTVSNALTDQLLKDPATPDALLTTIAKRAASKRGGVRKAEREAKEQGKVATADTGLVVQAETKTPAEVATISDDIDQTRAAVESLSGLERAAVQGQLDGKTDEQIAEENNTKPATIRNSRARALPKLRKFVEGQNTDPTNADTRSDEQVVEQVRAALSSNTDPRAKAAAKKIKVSKKDNAQIRAAKKIAKFFGRRVVVVNGLAQNGLFIPTSSNAIVISSKADRAETLIVFHEMLHSLRETNRAAYDKLNKAVDVDLDAYIAANPKRDEGTTARNKEEFLADFLADRSTDPEFWKKLAETDRTLFETLRDTLQKLIAKITKGRLGTERFVKDLKAADAAAAEALVALRAEGVEVGGTDGQVRFEEGATLPRGFSMVFAGEDTELSQDTLDAADAVASASEINILSGKELNSVVLTPDGEVAGVLYTEQDSDEFSFDIVVAPEYRGTGVGSALLNEGISEGNQATEYGEFGKIKLDVVNPNLVAALKRRGFEVTEEVGGHTLMETPDGARFEEQLKDLEETTAPTESAGQNNPMKDEHAVTDYFEAEKIIAKTTGFNHITQPVDKAGQKDAELFLTALLDPEVIKALQKDLKAAGYADDRVQIATGLARASFFAYATRVYQTDPRGAADLMAKGFILANDVKVLFFPNENGFTEVDASTIGATLRSFRTLGGGNVMTLLTTELEARSEFVKGRFSKEDLAFVKRVNDIRLDLKAGADTAAAEKIAEDAVAGVDDAKALEELKAHERRAVEAFQRVTNALRSISKLRLEVKLSTSVDALQDAIDSGNFDAMSAELDAAMKVFEEHIIPKIEKAADTARTANTKAAKARERATKTTKTKNQVDILGKRTIGIAERATNESTTKTNELLKPYKELLAKDLSEAEFVDAYVALGGTEEVAVEVYDANQTIKAAKAAKPKKPRKKPDKEAAAKSLFNIPQKKDTKGPKPRTLQQILTDDVINNPHRLILNQQDRIALAEEILAEKTDLTPEQIKKVATEVEKNLDTLLEAKKRKAAAPILKRLGEGGGLTPSQINTAIRLQVLDPSKDLTTSVAALSGWVGLTGVETAKLADLESKITAVGQNTRSAMGFRYQQMRIIRTSTGLAPSARKLLNSYIRGSMYSSTNSQFLGPMVGAWVISSVMVRETAKLAFDSTIPVHQRIGAILALHKRGVANIARGVREFKAVWATGAAFNASSALAGGQEIETQGRVVVDDLTTFYDVEGKRMAKAVKDHAGKPTKQSAARLRGVFNRFVIAAQRFTFIGLTSADAAATKTAASIQAEVLADRRARQAGLTKAEMDNIRSVYTNDAKGMYDHLKSLGLSDNLIAIEIQDKIEGSIFQAYTNQIDVFNKTATPEGQVEGVHTLLDEAVRDVQSQIGTGETNNTPLGNLTALISSNVNKVPFGPLVVPAVRTVGNVTDELMWTVPIVGLIRAYGVKFSKKKAANRAAFRNLSSDWQFNKRVNLAITSHVLTAVATLLLEANDDLPDEDKWFYYTGFFPAGDKAEQQRWKAQGWTEHTLQVGGTRIRLDRGFGQSMLFPITIASSIQKSTRALRDVEEGKLTPDQAHDKMFANLTGYADLVVPGWSSVRQLDDSLDRREGLGRYLGSRASVLAPFSGALKTPRRVTERIDSRQTDAAFLNYNPYYVNTDAEGVVVYRNAMFEPLENTSSAWEYVRKLGVPIYLEPAARKRDPIKKEIMDLRIKHGVTAGSPMTRQEFNELALDSGKASLNGDFNNFGEAVADEIVTQFSRVKRSWPSEPTKKQVSAALSKMTTDAEEKVAKRQGYRPTSSTKKRERAAKKARKPLRT